MLKKANHEKLEVGGGQPDKETNFGFALPTCRATLIRVAAVLSLAKRMHGGRAPNCALAFFSSRRANVVYEVDRQNIDLAKQFSMMTIILN